MPGNNDRIVIVEGTEGTALCPRATCIMTPAVSKYKDVQSSSTICYAYLAWTKIAYNSPLVTRPADGRFETGAA